MLFHLSPKTQSSYFYVVNPIISSHPQQEHALIFRDETAALTYFYQNEERLAKDRKTWLPFRPMNANESQLVVRQRQVEIKMT